MLIKINKVGLPRKKKYLPPYQRNMYSEAVSVHLLLESYSSPFFDTELIACLPGVYRV